MKNARFVAAVCAAALAALSTVALADDDDRGRFPQNATFTTRAITPFAIEGLTGDAAGNLYTTGRQTDLTKNCPVWRIAANGSRVTVGFIPNPTACNPSGITFDAAGNLYIADAATISGVSGFVWRVRPDPAGCQSDDSTSPLCATVPLAVAFASGTPGQTASPSIATAISGPVTAPPGSAESGRSGRPAGYASPLSAAASKRSASKPWPTC